jgi:hypothetical protein
MTASATYSRRHRRCRRQDHQTSYARSHLTCPLAYFQQDAHASPYIPSDAGVVKMRRHFDCKPAADRKYSEILIRLIRASIACAWCAFLPNRLLCSDFFDLQHPRVHVALRKARVAPPPLWNQNAHATGWRKNASGDRSFRAPTATWCCLHRRASTRTRRDGSPARKGSAAMGCQP